MRAGKFEKKNCGEAKILNDSMSWTFLFIISTPFFLLLLMLIQKEALYWHKSASFSIWLVKNFLSRWELIILVARSLIIFYFSLFLQKISIFYKIHIFLLYKLYIFIYINFYFIFNTQNSIPYRDSRREEKDEKSCWGIRNAFFFEKIEVFN